MHELTNLMGGYHKKVKLEKVHSRTHRRYVTSENTKIGSMPKNRRLAPSLSLQWRTGF